MKMTIKEVLSALSIKDEFSDEDKLITVSNVCFDSRDAKKGSLFLPLNGQRDGHDFIESAISNGASASFWQRNHAVPSDIKIPLIMVDDVLEALQKLAKHYLNKVNPKVVAITGSNGKTTTKDMVASLLQTEMNVVYTHANFNNEIGVPVTVLNMETNTETLVIELGMDRPGQISRLSELVQPDVAVITMVGEAHIEFFGTRDKIADAKMEIVEHLREDGVFIYNGDDPLLIEKAKNVVQEKITFGFEESNDIFLTELDSQKEFSDFKTNIWPETTLHLPLMGEYNVHNALAALAVAKLFRINKLRVQEALKDFVPTKNRTEWKKSFNGADILSDVYNSNPTAVKDVLINIKKINNNGRKIAVLGDMLELGDKSQELHESLAEYLNPEDFEEVYLIGPDMNYLKQKLIKKYDTTNIKYFDKDQLTELAIAIKADLKPEDIIVLKASNGIHLNKVLEQIQE